MRPAPRGPLPGHRWWVKLVGGASTVHVTCIIVLTLDLAASALCVYLCVCVCVSVCVCVCVRAVPGMRQEEIAAMGGPDEFAEFYRRLKHLKDYHRK